VQRCWSAANESVTGLDSSNLYQHVCVFACLSGASLPLSATDTRPACSSLTAADPRASGSLVCQDLSAVADCATQTVVGRIAMIFISIIFWYGAVRCVVFGVECRTAHFLCRVVVRNSTVAPVLMSLIVGCCDGFVWQGLLILFNLVLFIIDIVILATGR
jgi:hypothetical protein